MGGTLEVSWSELKTWQRCEKQYDYKYIQLLQPKEKKRAPYLGNWFHAALESYYRDGDWKIGFQVYLDEYNKLFDEEREELDKKFGPLPIQVKKMIQSYLWYYRNDEWEIIATEADFLTLIKEPIWAKGRIDLLIKDIEGLYWLIDHKTTSNIPDQNAFHAMDPQLMLYPWAIKRFMGINVAGIIYNYIKSRPPSVPKMTPKTGQVSRRKILTDYPTLYRFLVQNNIDPKRSAFTADLKKLQRESPFLKRYRLPREKFVTKEILSDFYTSAYRLWERRAAIEDGANLSTRFVRNITKDCQTMCSYHDLCRQELNGFDSNFIRKQRYDIRQKVEDLDVGDATWDEPDISEI